MGDKEHWEKRYGGAAPDQLSWYQERPERSLAYIKAAAAPADPLIDVGAGASTLVDHLLRAGFSDLTLLDLSEAALGATKERLGAQASAAHFIAADITEWAPPRKYKTWHDRAVFHFLTEREHQAAYKQALLSGLEKGGTLILGTFAVGGPEKCSGLPICQYDLARLEAFLGPEFTCTDALLEEHPTPAGGSQLFHWAVFKRGG